MLTLQMTKDIERAIAWVEGAHEKLLWSPPDDLPASWGELVSRLADLDAELPVSFYDEAEVIERLHSQTWMRQELPEAEGAAATAMLRLFYSVARVRRGSRQYQLFARSLLDFEKHLEMLLAECPHYHGEIREWFLD